MLKVSYVDEQGQQLHEFFPAQTRSQLNKICQIHFAALRCERHLPLKASSLTALVQQQHRLAPPAAIIARKNGRFWHICDKLFNLSNNSLI